MITNSSATTFTYRSDREMVMTRVFDAPRALVFKVYTDPELIPQWWGPSKYVTTVERMEVHPGGVWRYIQRDADGKVFAFDGVYREIMPPERLVSTFEFEGEPGHIVVNTATFEEVDGKTTLTVTSLFQSAAHLDGMRDAGMEGGAAEGMDRLAELLRTMA